MKNVLNQTPINKQATLAGLRRRACVLVLSVFSLMPSFLQARPILTVEQKTIGAGYFEAGTQLFQRVDSFNNGESEAQNLRWPVDVRFGVKQNVDWLFGVEYVSQTVESEGTRLTGSANAAVQTGAKWDFTDNLGLLALWKFPKSPKPEDSLPIGRGNNIQLGLLYHPDFRWPTNFNLGYEFRGPYDTPFGLQGTDNEFRVHPGNIIDARGSVEIPMTFYLNFLTELSYSHVSSQNVDGDIVQSSAGDAADFLAGLSWQRFGWTFHGGVAFGLLSESHTSFTTDRGAGDVQFIIGIYYKIKPKKPDL